MLRNHIDAECIALDNQKFRQVAEKKAQGERPFHRLRVDLMHANMAKISELQTERNCVILGKHVCGAATDFSLRALRVLRPAAHLVTSSAAAAVAPLACVEAIAIACVASASRYLYSFSF